MKRISVAWPAWLVLLLSMAAAAACSGANGDPAPVPQEAGASPDLTAACADAGVSG